MDSATRPAVEQFLALREYVQPAGTLVPHPYGFTDVKSSAEVARWTSSAGVWHGLDEAFFMFWETLWALVLGFALSGAVQAFVSRTRDAPRTW